MKAYFLSIVFMANALIVLSQEQPKVHFNHAALYVTDLSKAGHFYSDIIGLDTIQEPFRDGKHIWYKIGIHNQLHIIAGAPSAREYYKNQHLCFSVPDFNAFIAKLKNFNITFEDLKGTPNAVTSRVDGIHQIWLQDPDGYWIEINDDPY